MLEKILKLLDSFKENQISTILNTNRAKIVVMFNGSHFSAKIKPYFATMHAEGIPFTVYADQPKQVTQIKDFINALYHAEQAFLDLERVNLRDGGNRIRDIKQLYSHTIHHGYQASYLLTHLDVDLCEIFAGEIRTILPLLTTFQNCVDTHASETALLTKQLKEYPISYNAGQMTGIAVDQLNPGSESIDYSFLTQFCAVLPGYIEQFTAKVRDFSPQQFDKFEPTLDKTKLDALQKEGYKLLSSLENLQGDSIFLAAKLFYYADVIRHVISLSMSTLEQMGNLNESSQDVIRDNLAQLKYQWLVPLFRLADRLEDEALLTPGTLSTPLMEQIQPLYNFLIEYSSKVVNFSLKGSELLSIEDDQFLHFRLEESVHRITKAKLNLVKIGQVQADFAMFFRMLEKPRYANSYLINLSKETKRALAAHYTLLEPYIKKIDFDLNNTIIKALTLENLWSYSYNPWHWRPSAHEKFEVKQLATLKEKIKAAIDSDANTQHLHIELNEDIIKSVHEKAELSLYPYQRRTNIFTISEALALGMKAADENDFDFAIEGENCLITKADSLTIEQTFELHQYYADKLAKLNRAHEAYSQFMDIIQPLHPKILQNIDKETKTKLYSLYCRFQPYMVDTLTPEPDMLSYDDLIIANLSELGVDKPAPAPLSTRHFMRTNQRLLANFTGAASTLAQRSERYKELAGKKYWHKAHKQALTTDDNSDKRAHYLLKYAGYSKAIAEFKDSLFQLTVFFNKTTKEQLTPTTYYLSSGVPFPELEDKVEALAQSKQVLGIKQIFNSIYHLEQIGHQLEALNNKSTESVYVYHLIQVYNHLDNIVGAAKELQQDSYLSLIAADLTAKAAAVYQTLISQSETYRTSPDTITLPEAIALSQDSSGTAITTPRGDKVQFGGIWYPLNAFMLIPAQICALAAETTLSEDEVNTVQAHTKKVVLDIEGIITNSNSYFKLFLKTPVMYKLFLELKERLSQFSTLTHGAILEHLKEINTNFFTSMLLEADEWEDRLGLNASQLSGPMKQVLDQFYKGLVEPLGLVSQKHINLVTTMEPLEKRAAAVKRRKEQAIEEQSKFSGEYALMKKLMELFQAYDNYTSAPPPNALVMHLLKQNLIETYTRALPLLKKNKDLFTLLKDDIQKSPKIDHFITEETVLLNAGDEIDPRLPTENIEAHCKVVLNYYQGLIKTHELEIQTAIEKEDYLETLLEKQKIINETFVENYTCKAVDKQVENALTRHIGLLHARKEYHAQLKDHLDRWKLRIIASAKISEDIDNSVRERIAEKIVQFDQHYYRQYAHLESVLVALTQFKLYFTDAEAELQNNTSMFETTATLASKSRLVERMETIALDSQLTVNERFQQMKLISNDHQFERTMLQCSQPEPFTLAWLTQLVTSFLKLLHIYTPAYAARYEQLNEVISTPPNAQVLNRYRLFETPQAARRYALPQPALLSDREIVENNPPQPIVVNA